MRTYRDCTLFPGFEILVRSHTNVPDQRRLVLKIRDSLLRVVADVILRQHHESRHQNVDFLPATVCLQKRDITLGLQCEFFKLLTDTWANGEYLEQFQIGIENRLQRGAEFGGE